MNRRTGPALAAAALALALHGPAGAQEATPWCFTGVHPGEVQGTVVLPEGDVFCTLIADPKAERSFMSYLRGDFPSFEEGAEVDGAISIASVGLGDAFPIVRFGMGAGNGVQIGLVGSIFAQFHLDTESYDLINADYLVGVPVSFRWAGFSSRLRIYHQSSHLGDEFLLRTDLPRDNLSFEALDLIVSQEVGPVRGYVGGEILFNREPETLESTLAHGGVEIRVGALRGARFVGAVDLKASEQQDWEPGWSARAGVELALWRDDNHPPRLWGLLVEFYDGPSPYGQFFQDQVHYWGIGLHFSL
jgi:hypothetical protein